MRVGGAVEPAGRVGSGIVRMICIGGSGHGSSAAQVDDPGVLLRALPWLNQSWIMNCSQAAASEFTPSAAMNSCRVISRRLTSRGLGVASTSASASPAGWSRAARCGRTSSRPCPSSGRRGRCSCRRRSAAVRCSRSYGGARRLVRRRQPRRCRRGSSAAASCGCHQHGQRRHQRQLVPVLAVVDLLGHEHQDAPEGALSVAAAHAGSRSLVGVVPLPVAGASEVRRRAASISTALAFSLTM